MKLLRMIYFGLATFVIVMTLAVLGIMGVGLVRAFMEHGWKIFMGGAV